MSYALNWSKDGAYCKYKGVLTYANVRQAIERILEHKDFAGFKFIIEDLTEVERIEDGADIFVNSVALLLGAGGQSNHLKLCIVASSNENMQRYNERLSEEGQVTGVEVFASLVDAAVWLGKVR